MVKVCLDCHEVNAGGFFCVDCGGQLILTSDPRAHDLPDSVWKTQRVDYGARRGMILRFMAIFIGSLVGLYGVRESMALERPWSILAAIASILVGLAIWRFIYHAAGRAVRVWILAKGKVHHTRLARAILWSMLPKSFRRRRSAS